MACLEDGVWKTVKAVTDDNGEYSKRLGKQPSFQGVKERLTLIRQQRAEAAERREEEKAAKEQKKAEARK
ncbi:hypothetical protein GH714_016106 [Hevea brasiliensis]|uniref:Uncharacterized protein n=1 Tax=Hevea brasiliensis TaxID=3981 RepID=A0A6A6LUG8_HEVBR|nr:hypothetical protein GH714_016106 [Hevea brasiliensis]